MIRMYRPRLPEITAAVQYDGTNHDEITRVLASRHCNVCDDRNGRLYFTTREGFMASIARGQWLAWDTRMEDGYGVLADEWFRMTYEELPEPYPDLAQWEPHPDDEPEDDDQDVVQF